MKRTYWILSVVLIMIMGICPLAQAEDAWTTPTINSQAEYDLAVEEVILDYQNKVIDKAEYYSRRTSLEAELQEIAPEE